jgi:hypothetical protein
MIRQRRFSLAAGLALASVWLLNALPANAGCGCDHPPPAQATIMPPFASPGTNVRIYAVKGPFQVGGSYSVDFRPGAVSVIASRTDYLTAKVPSSSGTEPGPRKIRVKGPDYDLEYAENLFTALPPAPKLPATGGSFVIWKYRAAVDADGTMLIPLDVSDVLAATQLSFQVTDFPLAFDTDDVVIYNADGVDLTLFTLAVEDPTRRQWGEYYGWTVEQDRGIHGTVYDTKVLRDALKEQGDMLSYWRHDFLTYYLAHMVDPNHFVDANGYHADGTLHIDHGRIVLAVHGARRHDDHTHPLDPGKEEFDLVITADPAENPTATTDVRSKMTHAVAKAIYMRAKPHVDRVLTTILP